MITGYWFIWNLVMHHREQMLKKKTPLLGQNTHVCTHLCILFLSVNTPAGKHCESLSFAPVSSYWSVSYIVTLTGLYQRRIQWSNLMLLNFFVLGWFIYLFCIWEGQLFNWEKQKSTYHLLLCPNFSLFHPYWKRW